MHINDLQEWQYVRIRWRDAFAPHSGWHEVDEYAPEDAIATTIGRYWKDCLENYVTTVGTIFDYDGDTPKTIGDINHIPLGWILSIDPITIQEQHNGN